MSVIVDIIARVRKLAETGSRSDRRLAECILADISFASLAPIAELAARAEVSEPTVTRFSRALGCQGIKEFKFMLAQALAVGGAYLYPAEAPKTPDSHWLVDNVCDGAVQAIERIRKSIDAEVVQKIGRFLAGARNVLAIGAGGTSSMAALEMQNRLFRLGISTTAHIDGEMQRMAAASGDHQTVVIAFSISGVVKAEIDTLWITKQYGGTAIAVTAPESELGRGSDLLIPFHVQEDGGLYRPSTAHFAMLAIVDMIAMATAEAVGPRSLETLRRIKQNLNVLKVSNPQLPIGD